jgi:iron complex outermembrane recepter protein
MYSTLPIWHFGKAVNPGSAHASAAGILFGTIFTGLTAAAIVFPAQAEDRVAPVETAAPVESATPPVASDQEMQDVVVTATKTAKIVSEAPASVTVVTAREIENRNVQRIDEALAGAPGVFVRGLGGEMPNSWSNQITLRGIPGYYRTGVLVDGVAINNAFSGGTNMSIVPIDDIRQIEVVPGPFSSLYGGAGMSGIINIITKVPEKQEVFVKGEGGTHNFRSVDLGYRDRYNDKLGVSVAYGHKQSDGYTSDYVVKSTTAASGTVPVTGWETTSTTTGGTSYIIGDKGARAWEMDNYGVKLYLNPAPGSKLTLEASYNTSEKKDGQGNSCLTRESDGSAFTGGAAIIDGRNYSVSATDFLDATNGEDVTRYVASYEAGTGGSARLKSSLSFQENKYWYTSITTSATDTSGPGSFTDIPNNMTNGDVQLSLPLGSSNFLVTGFSANRSTLRKKVYGLANWRETDTTGTLGDWADGNSTLVAAYVQDEISATDKLSVYLGARYDRWSTDGEFRNGSLVSTYETRTQDAWSPKASAVYRLGQGTVIKGALGKAFKAPNLSDMYSTWGTSTVYWSNPDLKPEKATTAEIGFEHEFSWGTLVRVTHYQSDISDLIYSNTTGTNRYKYNAGKAEVDGFDAELRQKLGSGATAFINATHVTSEITENPVVPASVGKQIPLQPKKMVNVGLNGRFGPWSGSIISSYVGRMYSTNDNTDTVTNVPGANDSYLVTHVKLGYRISKSLSASLSVNNAFNEEYFTGSSVADGRTAYLGLSFKH